MIIRRLPELPVESVVSSEGWTSHRFLLKKDGMGFSMHDTIIHEGAVLDMHYMNHLEAVYCIEGKGAILDSSNGELHRVEAGTLYALDQHDKHTLSAETEMRMICVFNPPLTGREVHDSRGAYPLPENENDVLLHGRR